MFDIGFSELFLVAVVALIVLGPERLPRAARFAGLWVRRAKAQWYSVKSELERELADEELKRSLQVTQAELRAAQAQLHESGQALQRGFEAAPHAATHAGEDTPRPARTPPGPDTPGPSEPERRDPQPDPPPRGDPDQAEPERRDPDPAAPDRREPDPGRPGDPPPGEYVDRAGRP